MISISDIDTELLHQSLCLTFSSLTRDERDDPAEGSRDGPESINTSTKESSHAVSRVTLRSSVPIGEHRSSEHVWRSVRGLRQESGRYVACILERLTPADRTSAGQYMIHWINSL